MKKKLPLIVTIICVILLMLCIGIIVASNYLVNYGITRESNSNDRNVATDEAEEDGLDSVAALIEENEKIALEVGNEWHDTTPYEDVNIISNDQLKLHGEFYAAAEETNRYVILIHGYKQSGSNMYSYGSHYWNNGYNVLVIDHRSHGKSEGEYIGMGWLEKNDILQWISYLVDQNENAEIVLHGISMGAATVMMTSGEESLPEQVKVCVEDCGYTSAWDIFSSELKARFNLPEFPIIPVASIIADVRAGYNFKEASAINQVKKSHTPTLFIHGTEDGFVPFEMLQKVYDAAACEKEMFIVEGADHCDAVDVDVDKYFEVVFQFIDKYIEE